MNRKRKDRRRAGVTLIEMLVVVTIIALFAALVAPSMFKQTDKARVTAARVQLRNFVGAVAIPDAINHYQSLYKELAAKLNFPFLCGNVKDTQWEEDVFEHFFGDVDGKLRVASHGDGDRVRRTRVDFDEFAFAFDS